MYTTPTTVYAADNSEFVSAGRELLNWMAWGSLVAAVIALIVCGILMVFGRRHHNYYAQNGFTGIAWVTLGLVIIAAATGVVNQTAGWVDNSWANDQGGLPSWEEVWQQILDWLQNIFGGGGGDDAGGTTPPPSSSTPPSSPPSTQDPRLLWPGDAGSEAAR